MSILLDYKVQLINRAVFGKQIFTINDSLSTCLNDFSHLEEVDELLNLVNEVVNTSNLEIEFPTKGLLLLKLTNTNVLIYKDIEEWYLDNNIQPDYILSIQHFKIILEAWRDYLQE